MVCNKEDPNELGDGKHREFNQGTAIDAAHRQCYDNSRLYAMLPRVSL